MSQFRILHRDENFVVIDKPYGIHVHPPEDQAHRIGKRENGLALLRDQLGRYVYPVHRLDRSTTGALIYALSSDAARELSRLFSEREVRKVYYALVRGHPADRGEITSPLAEAGKSEVPARTEFSTVARATLPWANRRFESSRYSLLRVEPETGRFHQIRRHCRRIDHPIIGDSIYGDGIHNRHWRAEVGRNFLFLKCYSLGFRNPFDGEALTVTSRWNPEWLRVFERFGVCPREHPIFDRIHG